MEPTSLLASSRQTIAVTERIRLVLDVVAGVETTDFNT